MAFPGLSHDRHRAQPCVKRSVADLPRSVVPPLALRGKFATEGCIGIGSRAYAHDVKGIPKGGDDERLSGGHTPSSERWADVSRHTAARRSDRRRHVARGPLRRWWHNASPTERVLAFLVPLVLASTLAWAWSTTARAELPPPPTAPTFSAPARMTP